MPGDADYLAMAGKFDESERLYEKERKQFKKVPKPPVDPTFKDAVHYIFDHFDSLSRNDALALIERVRPDSEAGDSCTMILQQNIDQAVADIDSALEWIERGGNPQGHIKGRLLQARMELTGDMMFEIPPPDARYKNCEYNAGLEMAAGVCQSRAWRLSDKERFVDLASRHADEMSQAILKQRLTQ
jgi:hypothetical protein